MEELIHEIDTPDGPRRLGNIIPDPDKVKYAFTPFGSVPQAKLIPRDLWPTLMANYSGPPTTNLRSASDQNGVGQCNCEAAAAAIEFIRRRQGLDQIELSPADLYARINGGVDQGSLLEDALKEITTNGIGTVASCGSLWKTGYYKGPASATERAKYRALEVYDCPTFDHLFSAVMSGWVGVSGVLWYDNFTPGPDGWLPSPSGRAGGHAVVAVQPAMRIKNGQPEYGIWHQNSWGVNWPRQGANGLFVIPESAYKGPVGGWYAVRGVVDEGGILPPEPKQGGE